MGEFRMVDASIDNHGDHLPQERWSEYMRKFVVLIRRSAMNVHAEWVSPSTARTQSACVRFEVSKDDADELKHDLRSLAGEYGTCVEGWGIGWADITKSKLLAPLWT